MRESHFPLIYIASYSKFYFTLLKDLRNISESGPNKPQFHQKTLNNAAIFESRTVLSLFLVRQLSSTYLTCIINNNVSGKTEEKNYVDLL